MKPLVVLLITFVIASLATNLLLGKYDFPLSARIAMFSMLIFTAIGHFVFTKGMALMIPDFIPHKKELVFFTGLLEILLGIGLLIPGWSYYSAWLLILFFIVLLPANINAAIKHIDYQKGTPSGSGPSYLWFRVPLQILFIVWTYFSAIKSI